MKRWGAGSKAASESVVSRKDRRRKENTGGAGATEGEEGRRGSAELGGASERGHRPMGEEVQQQKRQKRRRGLEQCRGREEEPVRATCGGSSKNRPGEATAGRGQEVQAGGDGTPAPRPAARRRAPPSVTAPNLSRPRSPSSPSASRPLSGSWEPEEEVTLSALAFSASCAPVVGTPECCSGDRRALMCRSHVMLVRTGPHEALVLGLHCFYPVLMR